MDRQVLMVLAFLGGIALFMGAVLWFSNQKVAGLTQGLEALAGRRGWTVAVDPEGRWKLSGTVDGVAFVVEAERPRKNASRLEMQPHRTRFVAHGAARSGSVVVLPKDAPSLSLGGPQLLALVMFGKEFDAALQAPEVAVPGPFGERFSVRAGGQPDVADVIPEALRAGLLAWGDSHPRTPALAGWVGDEAVLTTGVVLTDPEEVERFITLGRMTVR
jgi:hypothetical protein